MRIKVKQPLCVCVMIGMLIASANGRSIEYGPMMRDAVMYRNSTVLVEVSIDRIGVEKFEYFEDQFGYRIEGEVKEGIKGAAPSDRIIMIVRRAMRDRLEEGGIVRVAGLSWSDAPDTYVVFALLDEEKWRSVKRAAASIHEYGFDIDDPIERNRWELRQRRKQRIEQIRELGKEYRAGRISEEEYLNATEGIKLEVEF